MSDRENKSRFSEVTFVTSLKRHDVRLSALAIVAKTSSAHYLLHCRHFCAGRTDISPSCAQSALDFTGELGDRQLIDALFHQFSPVRSFEFIQE
jgi:hypothetical protein